MDDSDQFPAPNRAPAPMRPLLGTTVLVVEDSRYASDAIRLLCLRSGARIRRADCLASARRHLQVYRPSILIVDLGLPDGSGLDLIEEAAQTHPRIDAILGMSGDDFARDSAIAAGADGFLAKPVQSLAMFQEAVLACLPEGQRTQGPRLVRDETVQPDPAAYRDDMAHAAEVLNDATETRSLDYVVQFLGSLARCAQDRPLAEAATRLEQLRATGRPIGAEAARIAGMVQDRLQTAQAV